MRNKYFFICLSLFISLFIYLFYRTNRTIVNEMAIRMISYDTYTMIKAHITTLLPLNNIVIYSLPEGLWVFCITLTSKPYYFRLYNYRIKCKFIPIIYCVSLEILQLLQVTNGRFDFVDIGVSMVFWLLGCYVVFDEPEKQNIFSRPNLKSMICFASYVIVYLSHVSK